MDGAEPALTTPLMAGQWGDGKDGRPVPTCCKVKHARTRPGMVREALLEGRVFWAPEDAEQAEHPCMAMWRQWLFTVRNSHPFCIGCFAHRLHPMNHFERRIDGMFQLATTLAGIFVASLSFDYFRSIDAGCHDLVHNSGADNATISLPTLRECQELLKAEGSFVLEMLRENNYEQTMVTTVGSLMVSIAAMALTALFLAIRTPCLREWLDWPLKGPSGLSPLRQKYLGPCRPGKACAAFAPCCGPRGCCAGCITCLTFNMFSILLRLAFGCGIAVAWFTMVLVVINPSSGTVQNSVLNDPLAYLYSIALGFALSVTVYWAALSFPPFALVWWWSRWRGAEPFPLPFRLVRASNTLRFPEEILMESIQAAPTGRGRSALIPTSRSRSEEPTVILGQGLDAMAQRAVDAMEQYRGMGARVGSVAATLAKGVASGVKQGVTITLTAVGRGGAAAPQVPPAREGEEGGAAAVEEW